MVLRSRQFPLEPGWRVILVDMGLDPREVLRRAELPEDLLTRDDITLDAERYFRFWRALEAASGDPLLPLRLCEVITTESFMPPLFAALCSPNLAVGVERIAQYKRLIGPMVMNVDARSDALVVSCDWLDTTLMPPSSMVAMELVFLVELARRATRSKLRPMEVQARVELLPLEGYADYFGCTPKLGAAHHVVFSRGDAERPFITNNPALWRAFEPDLRRRLAELAAEATTAERVRAVLLEALPAGQSSADEVARRLALSKRTLQRRLREETTTYQAVLNQTREALAKHYLVQTNLSGTEIAFLIGFDDPNSFFRAFHQWTGQTPQQVRTSH